MKWNIIIILMTVILIVVKRVTCTYSCDDIVLEQIRDQSVYIPYGSTREFRCASNNSATNSPTVLQWTVMFNDGREFTESAIVGLDGFSKSRMTQNGSTHSVLTLNAAELSTDYNVSAIKCTISVGASLMCSNTTRITIFGPPLPPNNIIISALTSNDVNVSWSLETDQNIQTTFTIKITASDFTITENTTSSDSFYIFSRNAPQCEVYRFVVAATNDAGVGRASEPITKGLPSLHPVEALLQHSVMRNDDEITIHITHESAAECMDDHVTNYTIHLQNENFTETANKTFSSVDQDGRFHYSLGRDDGVKEDSLYHYHVTAMSEIGVLQTEPRDCYTSDVQKVCGVITEEEVTVFCFFSDGARAIGCRVTLELSGEVHKTASYYASNELAGGNFSVDISTLNNSYHLFASEIKMDGRVGTTRIMGDFSTSCNQKNSSTGLSIPLLVVVILIGVSLLVAILIVFAMVILTCVRHQQGNAHLTEKHYQGACYSIKDNTAYAKPQDVPEVKLVPAKGLDPLSDTHDELLPSPPVGLAVLPDIQVTQKQAVTSESPTISDKDGTPPPPNEKDPKRHHYFVLECGPALEQIDIESSPPGFCPAGGDPPSNEYAEINLMQSKI